MADFHTYANSTQKKPRLGLDRIRVLMRELGNPEKTLRCIHIAGTNGKGSVTVFTDSILRHAGYRVGRYMSPNLVRVNERIAVNDTFIPDDDLSRLLSRVESVSGAVREECGEEPSQFEIWTAVAFSYFAEQACDYVVLEVGLGGLYDATNIIDRCEVSVITHIDLDHTEYLGNTLESIAHNKCGIIKDACATHAVISAPQAPEVAAVIQREATEHGNRVIFASPDEPKKRYGMCEAFYFPGYGDIRSGLPGVHQIENAAIALEVARLLGVDIFAAQCGITYARHPGRMEILREKPLLLYDGGHNPDGIRVLTNSLDRYLGDAPRTCIFACMRDKDIGPSLQMLAARPTRFLFTTVRDYPRAMTPEGLRARAEELGVAGETCPTLPDAIARADEIGLPTVICGSLYLYADLPEHLRSL